ncbi:hypothetical protein Glove_230g151 [Diversispora epigaea]|uniref:Uncharacterized protein n=1 Tax=Diversispora epigaea TaxID=1348612 RepID=A0A397IIG8_9GLOM|nr:hypothetical protein Glove_230g151 [Diversispora epigaea]
MTFQNFNDKEEYNVIIEMATRTMYDLMIVANKLEFEELSEKLENNLTESKASWKRTHFTLSFNFQS